MKLQWPNAVDAWFAQLEGNAIRALEGRLAVYSAVSSFRKETAQRGVQEVHTKGRALAHHSLCLIDPVRFRRWLWTTSYREALRLLLKHELISKALNQLDEDVKRLLRWCYVDQLTENEIARVLLIPGKPRSGFLFDDGEARRRMIDAHERLSGLLAPRFPPENLVKSGPYRDFSMIFPAPPTISRPFSAC